jgi:hypothetical protein
MRLLILGSLFGLSLLSESAVNAQTILDLLNEVNDRVSSTDIESLTISQRAEIESSLQGVLNALDGAAGASTRVICTISSNHSSFYRLSNGTREIGGDSRRDECRQLAQAQVNGLVCGRSLTHSSFFRVYNIRTGNSIGRDTDHDTCLRLIAESTRQFVCAVSTNHSSFYSIYDVRTGTRTGGDTSLQLCIEDINI